MLCCEVTTLLDKPLIKLPTINKTNPVQGLIVFKYLLYYL